MRKVRIELRGDNAVAYARMHTRCPARSRIAALVLASLAVSCTCMGVMDRHKGWHDRVKKGRKMELTAATFFGVGGDEEFLGVTETPNGKIVAVGNSWGPPFPETVTPIVLGSDQLWDVPLHPPGKECDKNGNPNRPPENNPNRTGFLVFYSNDLRKVEKVVRLGWGLASITASCAMKDGSLTIAGLATRNFRHVAKTAKTFKTLPAGKEKHYGVIEYEGVVSPGDVYVAKLTPDLSAFQWVYILEGHRQAPTKLYEGRNGEVCFMCLGFTRISGDAQKIVRLPKIYGYFRGVNPVDGNILLGGDWMSGTGREPWRMPWVRIVTPDGETVTEVYRWDGALVGHDRFRLVSDSSIRVAAFTPAGHVVVYGWSDGGNSVMARNPVDLEKGVASMGLGMSAWGAGVGSFSHIARFDPNNYDDCSYMFWAAYMQGAPNSVGVSLIRGMKNGSVILVGGSANWLVQTTTKWYRAANQYLMEARAGTAYGNLLVFQKNGWPSWRGIGGRGPYVTIFPPDFKTMSWSSAMARCHHNDVKECRLGVVAVSRCEAVCKDKKAVGQDGWFIQRGVAPPSFGKYTIAHWPEFLATIRKQGQAQAASPAKQVWDHLSDEAKAAIKGVDSAAKKVPADVRKTVIGELNGILGADSLYNADAWKGYSAEKAGFTTPIPVIQHGKRLLAKLKAGELPDKNLPDINRRLLEWAFPKYIFRSPKENQPPIRNAVQDEFGGGFSDGHIYMLRYLQEMED